MKNTFSKQELLAKGFEQVTDGDEIYLQFIADRDNYATSKYLTTDSLNVNAIGEYVKVWDGKFPLDEQQLSLYIKSSGGKEYFTLSELRAKGFELQPELNGNYKLAYYFEHEDYDIEGKAIATEEFSKALLENGTFKVLNTVNAARTGFKYLSESQIEKLIKRGGF